MNAVPGIFETIAYAEERLHIPPVSNRYLSDNGTPSGVRASGGGGGVALHAGGGFAEWA